MWIDLTKDNQTTELRPKQNWKFKVSPQNQYNIPFPNFILAFESYQHLVDDYITSQQPTLSTAM